jgi:hypothetical protein
MPLILGANSVSGGYEVDNSLRFNSGSSDYLNRTPASTTNQRTYTISCWYKRMNTGAQSAIIGVNPAGASFFSISIDGTGTYANQLGIYWYDGSTDYGYYTTGTLFRDFSAWYHIVVAVDTTQATVGNRLKVYINGIQQTLTAVYGSFTQNLDTYYNSNVIHYIGANAESGAAALSGYLSEFYSIDGQALTPSSFGETDEDTNIWKPIPYTGSFGTNGFYLEFKDSSALGDDTSGNGNDWTVNNLTSIDQTTDTPTNNFATFNPLFSPSPSNVSTFTEGNLKIATNSTSQNAEGLSTLGLTSGKWYCEFKLISEASGESVCGVLNNIENVTSSGLNGTGGFSVASNGDSFNNGSSQGVGNFSNTYTTTDIISVALDLDNNKVYFAKNGSWTDGSGNWDEANPTGFFTLTSSQTYFMGVGDKSTSQSSTWEANFGNPPFTISSGNADGAGFGNFEYAVPSGYYSLCTKNLANFG